MLLYPIIPLECRLCVHTPPPPPPPPPLVLGCVTVISDFASSLIGGMKKSGLPGLSYFTMSLLPPPPPSRQRFKSMAVGVSLSLSFSPCLCVSLSVCVCVSPPPPPSLSLSLGDVLDPKVQLFILIHGHSDLVRPVHDISVLVTPQPIRNFSCDVVGNQWQ